VGGGMWGWCVGVVCGRGGVRRVQIVLFSRMSKVVETRMEEKEGLCVGVPRPCQLRGCSR